jgi:hypothetical protein
MLHFSQGEFTKGLEETVWAKCEPLLIRLSFPTKIFINIIFLVIERYYYKSAKETRNNLFLFIFSVRHIDLHQRLISRTRLQ